MHRPRGYALLVVVVFGLVLASMSSLLLYATMRDNSEARQQVSSARAVYAAEGGVAAGIERVRLALATSPQPSLSALEASPPPLAIGSFTQFRIRYYDPTTGASSTTPPTSPVFAPIASGPNAGLFASQTPIQVLATATINGASSTVADAIRIDLIPIFQFAMFMDGDLELQNPAPITISGRVHANGNLYLSNASGSSVTFQSPVTVGGSINNHSSYDSAATVVSGGTTFLNATSSAQTAMTSTQTLPLSTTAQATYLTTTFGDNLKDKSVGQGRLMVPIDVTGRTACDADGDCSSGNKCARKDPADESGFCMPVVVSRPDVCGSGSVAMSARSNFTQSLGIELVHRPDGGYNGTPYTVSTTPPRSSNVHGVDFGPRFDDGAATPGVLADVTLVPSTRIDGTGFGFEDVTVSRHVPILNADVSADDPGAADERFYWKADIRIIDGIWYKKGSNVPVFDPENWDMSGTALDFDDAHTDLGHEFARVLRYSWFWDPRETRVYSTTPNYQRGMQIRTADFDVAAFNALLENSSARALLFANGVIPDQGIIVYMSETYDPTFEDPNTKASRSPNVRNFLNFYSMDNEPIRFIDPTTNRMKVPLLVGTTDFTPSAPNRTATPGRRPDELGWFPENIWGKNAPAMFRSLTPQPLLPQNPILDLSTLLSIGLGFDCQEPSLLTAAPVPATRPDGATRASGGAFKPPCIQAGATPLGAENAVRIVRAQTMPTQGFTFATDNRLYIVGDVNVATANPVTSTTGRTLTDAAGTSYNTLRDVPGKIAFVADSITLASARFSDRFLQRGGLATGSNSLVEQTTVSLQPRFSADHTAPATAGLRPWNVNETPGADAASGAAPNLCTLGRTALVNLPATWPAAFSSTSEMFSGADPRSIRTGLPFRINASLLMGDVPSCTATSSSNGNPSGGVNNFPRFIEILNSATYNVINGSMVSLFRSERGNSRFLTAAFVQNSNANNENWRGGRVDAASLYAPTDTHCVYSPPKRLWAFDPALTDPLNLPPGTPRVFANDRIRWVRR